MKEQSKRLGQENIKTLLFQLSVPSIIGMLVIALYNIVDAAFIGWAIGVDALAGVTVILPVHMFLMAVSQMLGIGASSIISRALGREDTQMANNVFGSMISVASILGFLICILSYVFIDDLLLFFGATPAIFEHSNEYLLYLLPGVPFLIILIAMNNVVRGEGNPKKAMNVMMVAALINIVLDYLFIVNMQLGTKGAAIATSSSWIMSFLYLVYYFLSGKSSIIVKSNIFIPKINHIKNIVKTGAASFFRQAIASVLIFVLNHILPLYGGELAIAVFGVMNRITMFAFMPMFGILQGANPIIGFNYGALQIDRVKKAINYSIITNTVFIFFFYLCVLLFSRNMFQIFSKNESLIDLGSRALKINMAFSIVIGFQIIVSGMFQAIGRIKASIILSLLRQGIILIPLLFIIPLKYGLDGVWISFPVADGISGVIHFFFYLKERKVLNCIKTGNKEELCLLKK